MFEKIGQSQTELDKMDKIRQNGQNSTKWTKFDKTDKIGQNRQNRTKLKRFKNGQKWIKLPG